MTEPGLHPGQAPAPRGAMQGLAKGAEVMEVGERPGAGVGAGPPEVTLEKAVPMRPRGSGHPHGRWAQPGTRANLKVTMEVWAHIHSAETDLGPNL